MIDSNLSMPMALALQEAKAAGALPSPNPRVGCIIVSPDGRIIGQGHTQQVGGPHAEIVALHDSVKNGFSTIGATAYVTLEPCSHHGRTGPCCEALVRAGIVSVVASIADPNPLVAGKGFEKLRVAGLNVDVGIGATESRELNIGFFSRMIRKKPWVRMKIAASLDGKTALHNGISQWITSDFAREDGYSWRGRSCAILTGIGTVLKDNPRLDVRLPGTVRQPHLIVVDTRLDTPLNADIFLANRKIYIYAAIPNEIKKKALEACGAEVVYLPGTNGKIDLSAMMHDLAIREINELHVEAGQTLNGALIKEGIVDEILVYFAPKLIGSGQGMAEFGPLVNLSNAISLEFKSTERVGNDLRIVARVLGHDQF